MKRRFYIALVLALLTSACGSIQTAYIATHTPASASTLRQPTATLLPPAPMETPLPVSEPRIISSMKYDVRHTLTITNEGPGMVSDLQITIATIRDYAPYQEMLLFEANPVEELPRIIDDYGNEFVYYEFSNIQPGDSRTVELHYQVEVNSLQFDWEQCEGDVVTDFLGNENHINTTSNEIQTIVDGLVEGQSNLCVNTRAFYDYVVNNLAYIAYNPEDVGSAGALRDGGGDCTEFADLLIALNRAAGIPANFLEGVTYDPGYQGAATGNELKHSWVEVYLPSIGWVPMDATWGQDWASRELYFAGMTNDHIVVTSGRNLESLEGGHFYSLYYWWEDQSPTISDDDSWTVTMLNE